ncbi:MAG: peroxidase [Flavobacteriales bacterium]|nr:MAG: peroxidase [Flavobacteriales bacterium]
MPFIKVIQPEKAEGELKVIYEDTLKKRGKIAEVHKIQSLNPQSLVNHMDLYLTLMFGKSPLRRYQREMIAVVVSSANICRYCIQHHALALNHFWKDDERVIQLADDFMKLDLSKTDLLLCHYAHSLTIKPNSINEEEFIVPMKNAGLDDRAILDAALVTNYFNFVNRMVLGLGVQLEDDGGKGYAYE